MWRLGRILRVRQLASITQRAYTTQQHSTRSGWNWQCIATATTTAVVAGSGGYWYASIPSSSAGSPQTPCLKTVPSKEAIQRAFYELQKVLPPEHVTVDEDILRARGYSDNSYHNEGAPNIVVYPRSTEEVVAVVNVANNLGQGGICLSFTEHMNNIVAFHPEDMDVVVQPGVDWEQLNAMLKDRKLFFPLDPGPGACIGGMVGTGCSGTNAVRYGTMKDWVINLTVVLPNGEVVKTRQRPRKSSAGYDLTRLYVGSEGTLGIVTEATLKLAVIPEEETVAVCDFPSIRHAAAVVPELIRAGVQIGAVELLDDLMMKAVCLANPSLGYEAKPTLFFKFAGSKPQIQHEIDVVSAITKAHQGGKFKYAKSEHEKEELWEGRKIALWSSTLLKENASVWTTDVVVPVSRLPDIIDETKIALKASTLPCPIVGHVGDGNFHVFILFDKSKPEEYAEAKRLNKDLVARAIKMEGSISGEHGVGCGKKHYMRAELGDSTVDLMKTIKSAIDPKNIMNPGKVLPDQ
ncbi:hypothetical protein DFQ30_003545 [Apophysomyces sp. BC1015]|nr:hypothetical protein DFQ30_003545 [Apophysomyces sp. BC1015]